MERVEVSEELLMLSQRYGFDTKQARELLESNNRRVSLVKRTSSFLRGLGIMNMVTKQNPSPAVEIEFEGAKPPETIEGYREGIKDFDKAVRLANISEPTHYA